MLPFRIPRVEWRERRQRPRAAAEAERARGREARPMERKDAGCRMSLLSAFTEEVIPPMPFVVLPTQEDVESFIASREMKKRKRKGRRVSEGGRLF
jgi:hypothetical protein